MNVEHNDNARAGNLEFSLNCGSVAKYLNYLLVDYSPSWHCILYILSSYTYILLYRAIYQKCLYSIFMGNSELFQGRFLLYMTFNLF